jgi:hypothetical protein
MTNIGIVIGWKHNHQPGMMTKDGVITEFPGGIPSQADQDRWTAEYEAEHDSQEYARNRATAYAPLGDQLDMQYHDSVTGSRTWLDHVEEIKARYPK